MFENKNLINCTMMTHVRAFKVESQKDYDGFESLCAFEIQHNRYIPKAYEEKEYENKRNSCEHEDDSYCMLKRKKCEHKRKIGYIKTGTYERVYPLIGQYVIITDKKAFVVSEEEFNRRFRKDDCNE